MFSHKANISNIVEDDGRLSVSEVIHKAYINVNEKWVGPQRLLVIKRILFSMLKNDFIIFILVFIPPQVQTIYRELTLHY